MDRRHADGDAEESDFKILARDAKGNPLVSRFEWTADALPRILRVPAGFMRDKTQRRVEELAAERGAATIDLALVEDGIEHGRHSVDGHASSLEHMFESVPVSRNGLSGVRQSVVSTPKPLVEGRLTSKGVRTTTQ